MKTVLILGASIMQIPAIREARKLGLRVCVVDGNPNAKGASLANQFKVVDLKDCEAVLVAARSWKEKYGLDGVFTAGTDFSYTVAYVASKLSLPSIDPEVALRATNKGLMRDCFLKHKVSIPRFYVVKNLLKTPEEHPLGFPVVVKPVDNMGGRGTRRCDDFESLSLALIFARAHSKCGEAIVEEYIEGEEYSIDAIVEKGEVTVTGFAKRHIFFPPWFIEMGHTIPAEIPAEQYEEIVKEFKKAVAALGLTNGAAKGDIKYGCIAQEKKPRPYIGEVAARLSGGFMSGWSFPYSSGVRPTVNALRLALGLDADVGAPIFHRYCAERAFISLPGVVKKIDRPKTWLYENRKSIKNVFLNVKPGDVVSFPKNNVEKAGNVLAVGESYQEASDLAMKAVRSFVIHLELDHPSTINWLFHHQADYEIPLQFHMKEDVQLLNLFEYLPKKLRRESNSRLKFYAERFPFSGLDWMGRDPQDLFDQLVKEQRLLPISAANGYDLRPNSVWIPNDLVLNVLLAGSHQGFCWLLDWLDDGFAKGNLADRLQGWGK